METSKPRALGRVQRAETHEEARTRAEKLAARRGYIVDPRPASWY